MKTVHFRFYEELNDFLTPEKRKTRFEHHFIDRASVKDMIESLGVPHTEIDFILANGKSVDFSYLVNDGDEISIYPVFESIDISEVQHLRAKPLREPKFVLDVHLGKLARYMRMIGLNTAYMNNSTDDELIETSLKEKRALLTKDRGILKRNEITHGYWIRNENTEEQLREVVERFDLKNQIKEFTRCLECNLTLIEIKKEKIIERLPPKVKDWQNEFYFCEKCDKIYWKGTHIDRMKNIIRRIKEAG